MGEVKNRSLRLDDENHLWLSGLPGRTLNDALTDYRASLSEPARDGPLVEIQKSLRQFADEIGLAIESLPDADMIADVMRTVIQEFKSQKATSSQIPSTFTGRGLEPLLAAQSDPASIPGVTRGPVGQFPCQCKHSGCRGAKFMGTARFQTLCPECAEQGHAGDPRECQRCYEDTGPA